MLTEKGKRNMILLIMKAKTKPITAIINQRIMN